LRVKSAPGFLVNRVLMPYMIRAAELYANGTQRESLDEAAKRFGMPMGPLELADAVGLDVCVAAVDVMAEPLGLEVPKSMRSMVDGGTLGRKSGRGFYIYDKTKPNAPAIRGSWPTATSSTPAPSSAPASRPSLAGRCITVNSNPVKVGN